MKKQDEFISVLDKNRSIVKYLWRIVVMLSIALVMLSIAFMKLQDVVIAKVELPATFIYKTAPVVVAGVNGANKVYYKLWGKYIIEELSEFTYENFSKKITLLENMMRPTQLAKKESDLNKFSSSISLNLISQNYRIIETKLIDIEKSDDLIKSATVYINGLAEQTIGRKIIRKECHYSVELEYNEGVIYVKDFGTDCF